MKRLRNSIGTTNELRNIFRGFKSIISNIVESPCLDYNRAANSHQF